MRRQCRLIGQLLLILASVLLGSAAAGVDVVEFGQSRLVGEVKHLERGKLYFKTEATDTIQVDWADVTALATTQHLRIEYRDGRISFGSLAAGAAPSLLAIVGDAEVRERPMADVVAFQAIESGFWDRLDVDASVGYAFARSTEVERLDLAIDVQYETERHSRRLRLAAQSSESEGGASSIRRSARYLTLRLDHAPYLWGWMGDYEDNDALNLEFRVLGALVGGRDFYPLPNRRLRAIGGLAVSEEGFLEGEQKAGAELLFGGLVDWYRFSSPELNLSSSLIVYPSLSETGRWRSQFDITLSWEIYDDLHWRLSFYDAYDSDGVDADGAGGSSVNDYGVSTGLGWSW
ncbi:MAG: DUF481 domain-containing protein [Pseudomonadales bacterium]